MENFLGRNIFDTTPPWPEWALQAYVVQEARRMGLLVIGDMAAGKRNPGMAKAVGLIAGHPDLSFWLPGGLVVLIEMKTEIGKLSSKQMEHHERLKALGFYVYTVYANCPGQAWDLVREALNVSPQPC